MQPDKQAPPLHQRATSGQGLRFRVYGFVNLGHQAGHGVRQDCWHAPASGSLATIC